MGCTSGCRSRWGRGRGRTRTRTRTRKSLPVRNARIGRDADPYQRRGMSGRSVLSLSMGWTIVKAGCPEAGPMGGWEVG